MYGIGELVKVLGLKTETQVRNRIEAIRDLIEPYLQRGPNNRILVDERGLELLRALQALCESGKTVKEAAKYLRASAEPTEKKPKKPGESWSETETQELLRHLEEEVRFLRRLLLENHPRQPTPWWHEWRAL